MAGSAPSLAERLRNDRAAALRIVNVSRETQRRLDGLVELLIEAAGRANLVARSTLPVMWTRHIADSLQLLPLAPAARVWIDLGSGAGFPGLPIACALSEAEPGCAVHLVESIGKKAMFLREAANRLALPVHVHHVRIEDFVKNCDVHADVVCARALAPLNRLCGLAWPLLRAGALGLFPKGQDVEAELTEASKYWNIEADLIPSKTSPQSRIVVVRTLARRPAR